MNNLKCYMISCLQLPIIRFEKDLIDKRSFCLEHLVEFLEYIRDGKLFHLLEDFKKIIPIYIIKE